jgi:hypothetical protein
MYIRYIFEDKAATKAKNDVTLTGYCPPLGGAGTPVTRRRQPLPTHFLIFQPNTPLTSQWRSRIPCGKYISFDTSVKMHFGTHS